jgi:hypothetical protein
MASLSLVMFFSLFCHNLTVASSLQDYTWPKRRFAVVSRVGLWHAFLVIVFCVTLLLICLTRLFLSDLEASTAVILYLFIFVRGRTRVMSIARYTASEYLNSAAVGDLVWAPGPTCFLPNSKSRSPKPNTKQKGPLPPLPAFKIVTPHTLCPAQEPSTTAQRLGGGAGRHG